MPVLEISYAQRCIAFRDSNSNTGNFSPFLTINCIWTKEFALSQVQQRAPELWKDMDANTRSLQLCAVTTFLKVECCVNGTHSLDEVGLGAYGLYKTLPGLDCTFPGFVPQHCKHMLQLLYTMMTTISFSHIKYLICKSDIL